MTSLTEVLRENCPKLTARQLEVLAETLQSEIDQLENALRNPLFVPKVNVTTHIDTFLGNSLIQLRERLKLTQKEVARRLDWSPAKVNRIELNLISVSTTDLQALLQLYAVSDQVVIATLMKERERIYRAVYARKRSSNTTESC